jgi:hypothetical protein
MNMQEEKIIIIKDKSTAKSFILHPDSSLIKA